MKAKCVFLKKLSKIKIKLSFHCKKVIKKIKQMIEQINEKLIKNGSRLNCFKELNIQLKLTFYDVMTNEDTTQTEY